MKISIIILGIILGCTVGAAGAAEDERNRYGPVKQNETLWSIALKHLPDKVTVPEMMMLILQSNPEAFDQGDINRLKVGSVLLIPTHEQEKPPESPTSEPEVGSSIDLLIVQTPQQNEQQEEAPPMAPLIPNSVVESLDTDTPIEPGPKAEFTQMEIQEKDAEPETIIAVETVQEAVEPPVPETRKRRNRDRRKKAASLFRYSYDVSVLNDDNVRLAQDDLDIRSDLITDLALHAKGTMELNKFSILHFGARATYSKFQTFDTLDNLNFDIYTRYRFGFNSGFTAPAYFVGGSIGGVEFTDTEMRDSTYISLSAGFDKWITTAISMRTGWSYRQRESKSQAYDTTQNRLFVNFDTSLSSASLIYTTLSYSTGDTVSSATPTLGIINVAEVIEPDDAFGGIGLNQFAYRIETDTIVYTIGYNRVFKRGLSLDVSARLVKSTASEDDGIGYNRVIFTAGLLGSF